MKRMRGSRPALCWVLVAGLCMAPGLPVLAQEGEETEAEPAFSWGLEAKANFRQSDDERFPISLAGVDPTPFPVPPPSTIFLESVDPGDHFEVSALTLFLDGRLGESVRGHAKIDFIDLYDRNPTSTDRKVDVDELWLRFGQQTEPGFLPDRPSAYLKIGKMPKFERQNDRHLESYGLVSTAFNRFEDAGVEIGADLGRHFYLKATATQGNPVFFRDPNALAGDNGTEAGVLRPPPFNQPAFGSGVLILYDAEIEDIDTDGDLELGAGIGFRAGSEDGNRGFEFLAWGYERTLADTVALEGTVYGGDLDLLLGPFNAISLPITSDEKREVGANLWLYLGGLSAFGQYVDQELAGLPRVGYEAELAWSFDLPLAAAVGGRQLFPFIQPAVRFSRLDVDFGGATSFPAPSLHWDWDKIDYGLRIGLLDGVDLTLEYSDNTFVRGGRDESNDEFLATFRWTH